MAWLIACPYHYVGIFGLVYFFVVLYFQVSLFSSSELENLKYYNTLHSFYHELYVLILKFPFLKNFISESFIDKKLSVIYFKVAND